VELSKILRSAVKNLRGLKTFDAVKNFSLDPTKVTVNVSEIGFTGAEAEEILRRKFRVQCELSDAANLLFLVTFADDDTTIAKLIDALKNLPRRPPKFFPPPILPTEIFSTTLSPRKTFAAPTETVPLKKSAGRICAEEVTFYPPGIPLIMPGEKISASLVEILAHEKFSHVVGANDPTLSTIKVVR